MSVTLSVWTSLFLLNVVLTSVLNTLSEKVDISVYFSVDAKESDILSLKEKLTNLGEVSNVTYVSVDEALEIFKKRHADDEILLKSVEELGDNPLEASLNVLAKDASKYESVSNFLNQFSAQGGSASGGQNIISKVNYAENKTVIERFNNIIGVLRQSGFAASLVLALITFLVAFNTVRLAIYSSREEITIMKLVGASNRFVRGPFIVEGVLHGLVASAFAFMIIIPGVAFIGPKLFNFLPDINLVNYLGDNFWSLLLFQTFGGVTLGIFSSWFAIRKYLKV
ncbi:MAG: permease-like cell division protein FtsX [Patescibacteria group bacterium]